MIPKNQIKLKNDRKKRTKKAIDLLLNSCPGCRRKIKKK